ncbi:MAG: hypothetical protein Q9167_005746 [Letrouitia subvulpina]
MLEGGLELSCIVTGDAIVFLKVDQRAPHTLHYHLAILEDDVRAGPPPRLGLPMTVIAQLLAFTIMAFRSKPWNKDWRDKAVATAQRWVMDWDQIERQLETPRSQRQKTPNPSAFKGRKGPIVRHSPHGLRPRRHDRGDDTSDDEDFGLDDDSSEELEPDPIPSKSGNTGKQGGQPTTGKSGQSSSTKHAVKPSKYCTRACLLGLVRKSEVDLQCPNADLHPRDSVDHNLHRLKRRDFTTLLQK